jgi:hypothetical protein
MATLDIVYSDRPIEIYATVLKDIEMTNASTKLVASEIITIAETDMGWVNANL